MDFASSFWIHPRICALTEIAMVFRDTFHQSPGHGRPGQLGARRHWNFRKNIQKTLSEADLLDEVRRQMDGNQSSPLAEISGRMVNSTVGICRIRVKNSEDDLGQWISSTKLFYIITRYPGAASFLPQLASLGVISVPCLLVLYVGPSDNLRRLCRGGLPLVSIGVPIKYLCQ